MQQTLKTKVTEWLLSQLPPVLIERMAAQGASGVQTHSTFGIGQHASFDQTELFQAVRRALARAQDEEPLISLQEKEASVGQEDDTLVLKIKQADGSTLSIPFPELGLLSSRRDQRLQALTSLLGKLGPMAPDFYELQQAAEGRELSDKEVGRLIAALWEGVAHFRSRTRAKLAIGAGLPDLVPDSLAYFELFCGPDPKGLAPKEYLETILPAYRKELLRRDLRQGLEACLIGALRDDLCPSPWLVDVCDDDLWNALQACQPDADPFSLLAALDLSLFREHDHRFREFSENAIARLTATEFLNSDGIDLFILIPALATYVLSCLNAIESCVLRAPFWRRMCAWMQAATISRLLNGFKVSLENIQSSVVEHALLEDLYIRFIDLRREPMFSAGETSTLSLRRELLKRLLRMQERHYKQPDGPLSQGHIERSFAELLKKRSSCLAFAARPFGWNTRKRTRRRHCRELKETRPGGN